MCPYKEKKGKSHILYDGICGGPPRLTYRDGQQAASCNFIFSLFCISFMYVGAKNAVQQRKYPRYQLHSTVLYMYKVFIYQFLYFSTDAFLAEA